MEQLRWEPVPTWAVRVTENEFTLHLTHWLLWRVFTEGQLHTLCHQNSIQLSAFRFNCSQLLLPCFVGFGVLLLFFVGLFVSCHLHTFLVREIQTHSHDSTRLISQDFGIKHKSRCGASPWTYQTSGCYCFCLCMLLTVTCEY